MKNALMKLVEDKITATATAAREKAKGEAKHPDFQVGDTVEVHLRIL